MRRLLPAFLAAALAAAGAASAQSPAETLAQFGLLGRWSRDCSQPSRIVPHVTFERVAGGTGAQYRMDYVASSFVNPIDNVRVLTSSTIALRILPGADEKDGVANDLVILREGRRYRTISSVGGNGKVHIRDGILVARGEPSPWNDRCD